VEKTETTKLPAYDPACYLCPGNTRATNGTVLLHPTEHFFVLFIFFFNYLVITNIIHNWRSICDLQLLLLLLFFVELICNY
jgi:galactose-1-phosphate uridylyltransferase